MLSNYIDIITKNISSYLIIFSISLSFIDSVAAVINVELFLLEFLKLLNLLPSSDISKFCLKIIISLIEASITDKELLATCSFV